MAQAQKRTIEEWRLFVKKWESSGMSQRKYCRREGLSYPAFSYWLKKVRKIEQESGLVKVTGPGELGAKSAGEPAIVIRVGEFRLEVTGEEREEALVKVLRAMKESLCSST